MWFLAIGMWMECLWQCLVLFIYVYLMLISIFDWPSILGYKIWINSGKVNLSWKLHEWCKFNILIWLLICGWYRDILFILHDLENLRFVNAFCELDPYRNILELVQRIWSIINSEGFYAYTWKFCQHCPARAIAFS